MAIIFSEQQTQAQIDESNVLQAKTGHIPDAIFLPHGKVPMLAINEADTLLLAAETTFRSNFSLKRQ